MNTHHQTKVLNSDTFMIFVLSIGHTALIFNQGSMHPTWNKCLHFLMILTSSSTLKSFQQIEHDGYFSKRCGKSCGFLFRIESNMSKPVHSSCVACSSFFNCLFLAFNSRFLIFVGVLLLLSDYSVLKFSLWSLNFLNYNSIWSSKDSTAFMDRSLSKYLSCRSLISWSFRSLFYSSEICDRDRGILSCGLTRYRLLNSIMRSSFLSNACCLAYLEHTIV